MSEPSLIAAIDLGGTRTKVGLLNEGHIVASAMLDAASDGPLANHLDEVLRCLNHLCSQNNYALQRCRGIGLLCTGLVDHKQLRVLTTNKKYDDATDFDFRSWSQEQTGLELRMENDARGALIGEWKYGQSQGIDNLMMMTIGTGIGTAVISEGIPIRGPNFRGGNLGGHILVRSGGRLCTCGSLGCLESEASGWALPHLAREHPSYQNSCLQLLDTIGFSELREAATAGDDCAISVWHQCLKTWGEALVSFIHMFDPQRIIISGGIANNPQELLETLQGTIDRCTWPNGETVEIVASQEPDFAGLIGASALFHDS